MSRWAPNSKDDCEPAPREDPEVAHDWVHLTAEEAPIHCVARATPEDFEVEELAVYEPSGEGAHLYLFVEKRGLTTREAVWRLARALQRPRGAFGIAGRKDRHASTRQWISVEGVAPEAARGLELPGLRVLRAELHGHKLRRGMLRGNRFTIRLRELASADRPRLERVLATVARRGLPNYFGGQRFGSSGASHLLGRLLVQRRFREYVLALAAPPFAIETPELAELRAALVGERRSELARLGGRRTELGRQGGPGRELAALARQLARRPEDLRGDWSGALRALDRELTGLQLSALQARIFNRVLARRVAARDAPAFDELAPGDLAWLHDRGAVFAVEQPAELAARLAAFELSPSGPIAGRRMTRAAGRPGELEAAALAAEGVALEDFRGLGLGLDQRGARRPLRVPPAGLELAFEEDAALLRFELPKGSYATALLAEIDKRGYRAAPAGADPGDTPD